LVTEHGAKLGSSALGKSPLCFILGVLIGQMQITIPTNVKLAFPLMFRFVVGYAVGPQFFRGLKSGGLPQVLFAIVLCVAVLLSAFVAAKLAVYRISLMAVLGVATRTINQLDLPPEPGALSAASSRRTLPSRSGLTACGNKGKLQNTRLCELLTPAAFV